MALDINFFLRMSYSLPEKYPHQLQLILVPLSDLCLCSRTNSMKALHRQMKEKFIETWQSCFTL